MHSAFVFGEESNVSQEVSRINGSVVPPAALIGTGIFIFPGLNSFEKCRSYDFEAIAT